ncbi:hypothetical protein Y1Q_0015105 [Alligator mississippiensis]|uniref:Uncharacterized protein n=1 Tax=Alligator mississippiensis TaxID=8496 RepID=A0A151P8R7_ALLMI|nr:hypothetical protein Y1Q_0015105 [Alligator mississippiensis]
MHAEGEQLQLQVQAAKQQTQVLEAENKRLREVRDQIVTKAWGPCEIQMPDAAGVTTLTKAEQKPQMLGAMDIMEKRLVALGAQLAKYIAVVKAECQGQSQEVEALKEALWEMETWLETTWIEGRRPPEQEKPPKYLGQESLRYKTGLVQIEKSTMTEGSEGVDPMTMKEEILSALMQCLNQKWEQLMSNHAVEMDRIRQTLEEFLGRYDQGVSTKPERIQTAVTVLLRVLYVNIGTKSVDHNVVPTAVPGNKAEPCTQQHL